MAELAFPIINNPKILSRVNFDFMKSIGEELVSRADKVFFKSNELDKIKPEKMDLKITEKSLFRKSAFGTSSLLLFYFLESQSTLMVPLLKHTENTNNNLHRMEKVLKKMNPSDFRYKMFKSRLESQKGAFVTYKIMIENKIRINMINKFYFTLIQYLVNIYRY